MGGESENAYMVNREDVSGQACREVAVDTGLFAAQEVSHGGVVRVSWL